MLRSRYSKAAMTIFVLTVFLMCFATPALAGPGCSIGDTSKCDVVKPPSPPPPPPVPGPGGGGGRTEAAPVPEVAVMVVAPAEEVAEAVLVAEDYPTAFSKKSVISVRICQVRVPARAEMAAVLLHGRSHPPVFRSHSSRPLIFLHQQFTLGPRTGQSSANQRHSGLMPTPVTST